MLRQFPLILLVVILYNFLALGGWAVGDHNLQPFLSHSVTIPVVSGDKWTFTIADVLQLVTLILLFVEIIKATRTTAREIVNHALSMLTFYRGADRIHRRQRVCHVVVLLHHDDVAFRRDRRATRSRLSPPSMILASAAPEPIEDSQASGFPEDGRTGGPPVFRACRPSPAEQADADQNPCRSVSSRYSPGPSKAFSWTGGRVVEGARLESV